jgi:deazaflavin-dependent oxidoreductase (nitroreductase family)
MYLDEREGAAELFRAVNVVVEPLVRAGLLGAPVPWWAGPIVVETRGRKTGRVINVPLLAARLGPLLLVSTVRGERSQWVKNLTARPQVRSWVGGHAREATAFVFAPGHAPPEPARLPAPVRCLAARLVPWGSRLGLTIAVLVPRLQTAEADAHRT